MSEGTTEPVSYVVWSCLLGVVNILTRVFMFRGNTERKFVTFLSLASTDRNKLTIKKKHVLVIPQSVISHQSW